MHRLLSASPLVVLLVACAPAASYLSPDYIGRGWRSDTPLVVMGLDFVGAGFDDRNFDYGDLIDEKLAAWNKAVTRDVAKRFGGVAIVADTTLTDTANMHLPPRALSFIATPKPKIRVELDAITKRIEPYVDADAPGYGYVVLIDQMAKNDWVVGHGVIFELGSGKVVVVVSYREEPSGWGLYHFYGTALHTIAKRVTDGVLRFANAG